MTNDNLNFVHRFVRAEDIRVEPTVAAIDAPSANVRTAATLLLLHGTGGD